MTLLAAACSAATGNVSGSDRPLPKSYLIFVMVFPSLMFGLSSGQWRTVSSPPTIADSMACVTRFGGKKIRVSVLEME
jgi:hypothetical protein